MPSIELPKLLGLTLVGDKPANENVPGADKKPGAATKTPPRTPSTPVPRVTTPRPPPRTHRQLRPRRRS